MKKLSPYVYLFATGHFSVDWAQGAIPALLPYFISSCNLNYQDAATLIFANMLLSSVSQPIFGYYSDKVSKPWFAPLGPILCGLCLTMLAFTQNYWLIFLCSMFSGFGSSIYHPEAARMVNNIAGDRKGQAMGTFSVGGNAGFAIGRRIVAAAAHEGHVGIAPAGGIQGQFGQVLPNYLFLGGTLDYAANAVQLNVGRNGASFASVGATRNQRNVAAAAEQLGAGNPVYESLLQSQSAATAQQGLQHLWPVRMHAGSLARRKNQSRVLRHEFLLRSPHRAKNCAGRPIASCGANSKTTGKKRRGGFMPDLRASAAACPKYKVWHRCCADGHPSLRQKYRPA